MSELKPPTTPRADPSFQPFNRKYLGSKRLLGPLICDTIRGVAGVPSSFLDGFCGTGAIAIGMSRTGAGKVIAVDNLLSNCVILRGFRAAGREFPEKRRMPEIMARLNSLTPRDGYITDSFADTYFTRENCARMDSVREEISALSAGHRISPEAHDYLLAAFLLEADRVANTLGQYDAFLKNISSASRSPGGRHLVDERVRTPFRLKPLAEVEMGDLEVVTADLLQSVSSLSVDAAYFDPPYNGRQYCDNYHVLENLTRWEKPPVYGKTRKFDRSGMRSPFSTRGGAAPALRSLIESTPAWTIFLSYSSEGILDREEIVDILSAFGEVGVVEMPYPVFGNGAGVSRRRLVTEYLFHLERERGGP